MKRVFLVCAALVAAACSGAQSGEDERGEVFCESYENTFLGQCRQNCDATTDGTPEEVGKQCTEKCNGDLKDDDTFSSDCPKRAKEL
jgi:hypothetical protein